MRGGNRLHNKEVVLTYFKNKNINVAYDLWITSREMEQFELVESRGKVSELHRPTKLTSFQKKFHQFIYHEKTYFYFKYPEQYQMVLRLYAPTTFTDDELHILYFFLYPYYTNFALDYSQYKLKKVISSIRQTTSTLDLERLFATILKNTLDVIPNADLGTLWLYDSSIDRIVCKASVGNVLEGIKQMEFKIGEGPIGHTFAKGKPLFFKDSSDMNEGYLMKISTDNIKYWDTSYDFTNRVKSILTCPIEVDGAIECVMFLCQINTKEPLLERDLTLLQGFSHQVGIAIQNARQFSNINALNETLLKRDNMQTTLTKASMQNRGTNQVIRELRRMVERPITFIDLLENKIIPSQGNLPHHLTYNELNTLLSSHVEKQYITLKNELEKTHYLYLIRSGKAILGCLMIETSIPLSRSDHMALQLGTSVLALELVKKQNLVDFYYKNKREIFNRLIQERDKAIVLQEARKIGIKERGSFTTAIVQFGSYTDSQVLEVNVHQLITRLKNDLTPFLQTIFGYHNKIIILLKTKSDIDYQLFLSKIKTIVTEHQNIGLKELDLYGGIGSAYETIYQIKKSYEEAKAALAYLVTRQLPHVIQYSEIGMNRLFIHQSSEELEKFLKETFQPLRDVDQGDPILEHTLITYFKCNRSVSKTAKKLHIHINTMYQRLSKIEDILNMSFKNGEHVLQLQLACYLKETFGTVDI